LKKKVKNLEEENAKLKRQQQHVYFILFVTTSNSLWNTVCL
jgi:hypothetical protein